MAVPSADLVARLQWLGEHERATLIEVLATVEPTALRLALSVATARSGKLHHGGPA